MPYMGPMGQGLNQIPNLENYEISIHLPKTKGYFQVGTKKESVQDGLLLEVIFTFW